jgi:hypothetical protein
MRTFTRDKMPETGELWRWRESGSWHNTYTVLLLQPRQGLHWNGLIVSEVGHGETDIWSFENMDEWERIA